MSEKYLLKTTYSWGDKEPEMCFSSFDAAWNEAKKNGMGRNTDLLHRRPSR